MTNAITGPNELLEAAKEEFRKPLKKKVTTVNCELWQLAADAIRAIDEGSELAVPIKTTEAIVQLVNGRERSQCDFKCYKFRFFPASFSASNGEIEIIGRSGDSREAVAVVVQFENRMVSFPGEPD